MTTPVTIGVRMNRAVLVFLGLAGAGSPQKRSRA